MILLYAITILALLFSLLLDKNKTFKGIKLGMKKLWKITPPFIMILIIISFVLEIIPQNLIVKYLGGSNQWIGMMIALALGSITIMPGPIAYPLCKILLTEGVSYGVIAAFTTSLMMVGVLTFSVEKGYFGIKFTIIRNIASLLIAIIISVVFSLFQGFLL